MTNKMKIEKQITNLELSKKLKELGVKQDSLFYWTVVSDTRAEVIEQDKMLENYSEKDKNWVFSAFTVAELGEMLPEAIVMDGKAIGLTANIKWWVGYGDLYKSTAEAKIALTQSDKNEASARAKMLIYLIENNLIKSSV